MSERESAVLNREFAQTPERPWPRIALGTIVLVVPLTLLYASVMRDLIAQWWDDPNYLHCFLVPVFSGFLVWQRRRQLTALVPAASPKGFLLILAGGVALILGDVSAENFVTRSSLIIILAGLVLYHLGPAIFRVLAFPVGFLFFMIPLPAIVYYAITFPLQSSAAKNAARALHLFGFPVQLDGNIIQLGQVSLGVSEACSGIRSLISLVVVAVALAYLSPLGIWAKLVLIMSAIPITIVANVARIVATGLIAQWLGAEHAGGFFHYLSGWFVFVIAMMCLLGVHRLLPTPSPVPPAST